MAGGRYRDAADKAHAALIAKLRNQSVQEQAAEEGKLQRDQARSSKVFGGKDEDRLDAQAQQEASRRSRALEDKVKEYAAAAAERKKEREAQEKKREASSSAREAAEEARDEAGGGRVFTTKDSLRAEAAAEKEASAEEGKLEHGVER
jgi:hypothetical protein